MAKIASDEWVRKVAARRKFVESAGKTYVVLDEGDIRRGERIRIDRTSP